MPQNHAEGLLKYRVLGATSRASDSVGGGGVRICISSKFSGEGHAFFIILPGDSEAAGPILENYHVASASQP